MWELLKANKSLAKILLLEPVHRYNGDDVMFPIHR